MEFPDLGKHCSFAGCGLLDFLPYHCSGCSKTFCHEHRTLETHLCPSAKSSACVIIPCPICTVEIGVSPSESADAVLDRHISHECAGSAKEQRKREAEHKCSRPRCKVVDIVPIMCTLCNKRYCTSHRHPSDHKCPFFQASTSAVTAPVVTTVASSSSSSSTASAASAKMQSIMGQYASQTYSSDQARQRAEVIRNNRLKHLAKGDKSIPAASRVHLEVVFPLNKRQPSKIMFFDERWTIGKVLDVVTDEGRIENRNHIPSEEQWVLYSLASGEPLPNSCKLRELSAKLPPFSAILLEKPSALV